MADQDFDSLSYEKLKIIATQLKKQAMRTKEMQENIEKREREIVSKIVKIQLETRAQLDENVELKRRLAKLEAAGENMLNLSERIKPKSLS